MLKVCSVSRKCFICSHQPNGGELLLALPSRPLREPAEMMQEMIGELDDRLIGESFHRLAVTNVCREGSRVISLPLRYKFRASADKADKFQAAYRLPGRFHWPLSMPGSINHCAQLETISGALSAGSGANHSSGGYWKESAGVPGCCRVGCAAMV